MCKKKSIFEACMLEACARPKGTSPHGVLPPMWVLSGDLNTASGALLSWKSHYENDGDPDEYHIQIHVALQHNNKHSDIMLSQGFSAIHVESTIGCSERSRKHISDNHNMVTLRGYMLAAAFNAVHPEEMDAEEMGAHLGGETGTVADMQCSDAAPLAGESGGSASEDASVTYLDPAGYTNEMDADMQPGDAAPRAGEGGGSASEGDDASFQTAGDANDMDARVFVDHLVGNKQ